MRRIFMYKNSGSSPEPEPTYLLSIRITAVNIYIPDGTGTEINNNYSFYVFRDDKYSQTNLVNDLNVSYNRLVNSIQNKSLCNGVTTGIGYLNTTFTNIPLPYPSTLSLYFVILYPNNVSTSDTFYLFVSKIVSATLAITSTTTFVFSTQSTASQTVYTREESSYGYSSPGWYQNIA